MRSALHFVNFIIFLSIVLTQLLYRSNIKTVNNTKQTGESKMTETKKIKNLYAYLKKTTEDRIIIRTSYVAGGWHDNEFDANAAGFDIYRFINPEYVAKREFPECYELIRRK